MLQIKEYVDEFGINHYGRWFKGLEPWVQARVQASIDRLALGLGDVVSVGGGVLELRIHFGSGYRIYFTKRDGLVVLLVCGGIKRTQKRDILLARNIWQRIKLKEHISR